MKKTTRIVALILSVCLLFSACSGQKEDSSATSQQNSSSYADKIALPYNEADGLNPYFAQSYENLYICALLFQPLYSTDSTYIAKGVIAESIQVTENIATVKIRQGVACKGFPAITADDVVYSFNKAKDSYAWGESLNGVKAAEAVGQYTVNFTLTHSDVYVYGKLDFPIVKSGTADDEDAIPTGSGSYYYSDSKIISVSDSGKAIRLSPIGTRESAENAITIGVTDVFFDDLSECNYTTTSLLKNDIQLNNMVYLGLNSENGALNRYIRNAIAARLDSDKIALSSYQGHAAPVKLPIDPASNLAGGVTAVNTVGDIELARNIIDRCGYTNDSGDAKTNGAYVLSFTLIVNKENKFRLAAAYNIADALNECGFLITVKPLPFEDYMAQIKAGTFDMYIGEVKLDYSMDVSGFFTEGNVLSAGIDVYEEVAKEYFKYRAGEITATTYYETFAEYYPFIPVVFRKGYVLTSNEIKLNLKGMPYSLYSGI